MNLGRSVQRYAGAVAALEEFQSGLPAEQVLVVLRARDDVQAALVERAKDNPEDLIRVIELDRRLKQQTARITQTANLADWRASFQPSDGAWWWFLESPPSRWERFDWLWIVLTVLCLIVSAGLVVDISSRLLAGGPDTWAALTLVAQSVLTLLAAGGVLTVAGQEATERMLVSFKIPARFWHEAKFALTVILLAGLLILRFSLPGLAAGYNNQGVQNYQAGRLTSAQSDYLRAIRLNPDYLEAHYNLGVLYEDLQQIEKARTEYLAAVQGGLDVAHNNLGRLDILAENYDAAILWLKKGLLLAQNDEVEYDLHKNLGWARLEQRRYEEAITELQAAIALFNDKAPAHCLLAQVLEKRGDQDTARAEWETCLTLADPFRPDEDTWMGMARERLTTGGE